MNQLDTVALEWTVCNIWSLIKNLGILEKISKYFAHFYKILEILCETSKSIKTIHLDDNFFTVDEKIFQKYF